MRDKEGRVFDFGKGGIRMVSRKLCPRGSIDGCMSVGKSMGVSTGLLAGMHGELAEYVGWSGTECLFQTLCTAHSPSFLYSFHAYPFVSLRMVGGAG